MSACIYFKFKAENEVFYKSYLSYLGTRRNNLIKFTLHPLPHAKNKTRTHTHTHKLIPWLSVKKTRTDVWLSCDKTESKYLLWCLHKRESKNNVLNQ